MTELTLPERLADCLPKVGEPEARFSVVETADLRAILDGLAQYLKEDETPAQRIERERADTGTVLKLLAREKKDAERYRKLRAGHYSIALARSILNDTPHGIDAAVDALPQETI